MFNKIKFSVFLPSYTFGFGKKRPLFNLVRDVALECERLGYYSVLLDDHLMIGKNSILECWTTLSALSAITKRIRLGTLVLCNSFRKPTLLAKMAATLDVISSGRLEFGIGAGVQKDEHIAYGIPFPKPNVRIERMKEAVEIIKKMWTEEKPSYRGKYYTINGAICKPKPTQKPHPPIIIGGGGEALTMKVTAQHADRYDWGYLPSLERYKQKLEVLEQNCKAIDRNLQEIEKSCWPWGQILIALNRKELEEKVLQWKPMSVSLEDFERTNFVGTPDECIKRIEQYTNLGVTHFNLFFGDLPEVGGMRLFAEKVARKIKPS